MIDEDEDEVKVVDLGGSLNTASDRARAVEKVVQTICEAVGTGPDDGILVLLIAAVSIALTRTTKSKDEVATMLIASVLTIFDGVERGPLETPTAH